MLPMIRLRKYVFSVVLLLTALTCFLSCSDEALLESGAGESEVSFNADGTMNVSVVMEIPEMQSAIFTRGMNETPDYENLGIYMLVFEEGEGLKQSARLSAKGIENDETHHHESLITFTAELEPTEKNATIHLIATDQPDFSKQISYGMEERVVTSLYTNNNHEAYWQRIVLGSNIPNAEQAGKVSENDDYKYSEEERKKAEAIVGKLSHVPMIRNFCKVSVKIAEDAPPSLKGFLTGLYVINTVDRGSVAPYVASNEEGKRFVEYCQTDAAGNYRLNEQGKYIGVDYRTLTDEVGYIGHLPAGVSLINTIDGEINTKSEDENGNLRPVYFYERPARTNSTERTYVIIRGNYEGKVNYYKLDLGYIYDNLSGTDEMIGLFEYYNLLRNFNYEINIHSVEGEGYASLKEAAKGAVFNNFSASVEARSMNNISDGTDYIYVSFTSYVFTKADETVDLLGQYRENINDGTGGTVRNSLIKAAKGEGEVIKDYSVVPNLDNKLDSYNTYTITSNTPTDRLKRQEFYVYRGNKAGQNETPDYGLYRIVTLFLHTPWPFRHIDTFPGLWESIDDLPEWDWSEDKREVGHSKGSPLTLFFELPPDLPQAMFPLEFVIESDRQNIQNAYQGNAVVRSVQASESLFKDRDNPPKTSRIQYVKTVTWEDYYGGWSDELVGNGSVIVRCRFLTITDLEQDGIGGSGGDDPDKGSYSETTLRVYNPYFGRYDEATGQWIMYHEDGFVRDTETSDPTPLFWDFSLDIWDDVMDDMNKTSRNTRYTENGNVNFIDGLRFVEAAAKNIMNDTDGETGLRYVQTSNAGDIFRHNHTYDNIHERIIRVAVMSTDISGNSTAPKIQFSNVREGTKTSNLLTGTFSYTETDTETGPYTKYIYDISIPSAVTTFDLDVMPAAGNPSMRFYQIDFWPRWDEYKQ